MLEIRDIKGKTLCSKLYLGQLQVSSLFLVAGTELVLVSANGKLNLLSIEQVVKRFESSIEQHGNI